MRRLLSVLLLVALLAGFPVVAAHAADDAERFDRLIKQFKDARVVVTASADRERLLTQLRDALPANDATRALHLDVVRCQMLTRDHTARGIACADRLLPRARALADREAQIALQLMRSGDPQIAARQRLARLDDAVTMARRLEDPRALTQVLYARGSARSEQGESVQALIDLLEAQRIYRSKALTEEADLGLLPVANAWRRMGDLDTALGYLDKSRQYARRVGNVEVELYGELQTGYAYLDSHRYDEAFAALQRALTLAQRTGSRGDAGSIRLGMAMTRNEQRRHRDALELLHAASADLTTAGDSSFDGMILLQYGRAWAGLGEHRAALEHYQRAASRLQALGNARYLAMLLQARAPTYEALGLWRPALADLRQHAVLRQQMDEQAQSQQAVLARHGFDASLRELDHERLEADNALNQRQLAALRELRQWQVNAAALGLALVLALGALMLQQRARTRRLGWLAMTDELTGVANRRRIELFAEHAMQQARKDGTSLAVLVLDIDHFKPINDRYGHAIGDRVLTTIAQDCQAALRQQDLIGRIGGEEFLIVLPGNDEAMARRIAERLRSAVEALHSPELPADLHITASFGLATLDLERSSWPALLAAADSALYLAKAGGRNRVEVAGSGPDPRRWPDTPAASESAVLTP